MNYSIIAALLLSLSGHANMAPQRPLLAVQYHAARQSGQQGTPNPPASGPYEMIFPQTDALPNPKLTPGALNPAVTTDTMKSTICRRKSGYTRTIRPKVHYTEELKRDGIRAYRYPEQLGHEAFRLGEYEEDHLIPLEIGGSPTAPQNLWPEPHHVAGGWGSRTKDQLENRLHFLVCSGRLNLADAQREIATNWIAAYQKYVGVKPGRRQRRSVRSGSYPTAVPIPQGHIIFPTAIFARFAQESAGRARMHTCAAQYDSNKTNNANGGLKWTQRGGGYYSLCNKRLKAH